MTFYLCRKIKVNLWLSVPKKKRFWVCVLCLGGIALPVVMVCSGAARSMTQGPSAGPGFPLFETLLQAGTHAPSSLLDAAVALFKDLFMCVGALCLEAVL